MTDVTHHTTGKRAALGLAGAFGGAVGAPAGSVGPATTRWQEQGTASSKRVMLLDQEGEQSIGGGVLARDRGTMT